MTYQATRFNKQKAKGQATTELLVSLAVIAPLFILIPVVANYLDIQTATHEASRYVAWERTAYATVNEGDVANAVRERFIQRESSGFSAAAAANDDDARWRDYGSIGQSSLIDGGADVGVKITSIPLNVAGPASNSPIGAIQALNANAFASTSVSFPLAGEGSLLGSFTSSDYYLDGGVNRTPGSAPMDDIAGSRRFHTESSAVLLAANNIIPQNAAAYQDVTDSFVSTDGGRLSAWQAPLRILNFLTLGFFGELDILSDGGDLEAVADDQSTILPDGLIEYE